MYSWWSLKENRLGTLTLILARVICNLIMNSLENNLQKEPKISYKTLSADDKKTLKEVAMLDKRISDGGRGLTIRELKKYILQGTVVGVIYSDNQVAGLAFASTHAEPKNSKSIRRNLPEESIYAFASGIDPAFRGKGLQKILIEKRIDLARQLNKETIIGSVRPENGASIRNIE